MRKPLRRTIFYAFVLVFVVVTPFLILYAFGYTLNLARRSLTATGGFFVKTNVTEIKISVNGVLQKETNFLSRGAMVNGLSPGFTAVEIDKDGFYPWRKSVEIKEQLIQEFRSVLLIPRTLQSRMILGTTTPSMTPEMPEDLLPDPAGKFIAYVTKEKNGAAVRIVEISSAQEIREAVMLTKGAGYQELAWNGAGTSVLLEKSLNGRTFWDIIPASPRPTMALVDAKTNIPVFNQDQKVGILAPGLIRKIRWSPRSSDEFYLEADGSVYRWDLAQNHAEKILENVRSFGLTENEIFFVTANGFLAVSDLDGKNNETLDRPGVFLSGQSFTFLKNAQGQRAVIDPSGGLYLENPETKKFMPLGGGVTKARFADNAQMLVYAGGSRLSQVLLADEAEQPFRKRYAKADILDAVTPLGDFIWFGEDSTHLIFTTENGVFIAEDDPRFGANATTLKTGEFLMANSPANPNVFYLADGKTIEEITIQ